MTDKMPKGHLLRVFKGSTVIVGTLSLGVISNFIFSSYNSYDIDIAFITMEDEAYEYQNAWIQLTQNIRYALLDNNYNIRAEFVPIHSTGDVEEFLTTTQPDLVFGPMTSTNVDQVEEFVKNINAIHLVPLATAEEIIAEYPEPADGFPRTFQFVPSDRTQAYLLYDKMRILCKEHGECGCSIVPVVSHNNPVYSRGLIKSLGLEENTCITKKDFPCPSIAPDVDLSQGVPPSVLNARFLILFDEPLRAFRLRKAIEDAEESRNPRKDQKNSTDEKDCRPLFFFTDSSVFSKGFSNAFDGRSYAISPFDHGADSIDEFAEDIAKILLEATRDLEEQAGTWRWCFWCEKFNAQKFSKAMINREVFVGRSGLRFKFSSQGRNTEGRFQILENKYYQMTHFRNSTDDQFPR